MLTLQSPANTRQLPANTRQSPANTRQSPANTRQSPANTRQSPANTRGEQSAPALHPRPSPTLLPGGQGSMAWEESSAQHHPSPHRGVEGSQRASAGQATTPHPRPPASPLGVVGRSSWRGSTQLFTSSPPPAPSRAAPTWADIARGATCTQREAPSITPADIIAIYQRCAAAGVQTRFSVKNLAGFEEVCLTCRFIDTATPCAHPAHPARRRLRQRRRHRGKPASSSTSTQTEPIIATPTSRPHRPTSPTSPPRTTSPTAPPPAKKTRKRRCELELLRDHVDDQN
jgi:hypothetical protein